MALKVVKAGAVAANTPFVIQVPGQEIWTLLSVVAVCARAAGGIPNRAFQLAVSDGTNNVIVSPATDAGTEPGTITITWTDAQAAAVAAGAIGTSIGPLAHIVCPSGYVLTGTVLAGTVTDQWTSALAWVNYTAT